jgi:alpha-D-ribose 1-methylphosphonate 5-triphosphate synthase subunit PhnG
MTGRAGMTGCAVMTGQAAMTRSWQKLEDFADMRCFKPKI